MFFACDSCRSVFESKAALHRHVATAHSSVCPDTAELSALIQQLREPGILPELLEKQSATWATWGEMTFHIARQRDAGPTRLEEACLARQQLQAVVQRWRPTASVFIFGSSVAMGVWDGLSDIDFSVIDVDAMEGGEWPPNERSAVRSVANHLRRIGFAHPYLEAIEHARVPIIKHTAPSAFSSTSKPTETTSNNSKGEETSSSSSSSSCGNKPPHVARNFESVLSRSVRFLFDTILDEREMAAVEAAVQDRLGGQRPERVWWDVAAKRHTLGITVPTTTQAVQLLIAPPASMSTPVVQDSADKSAGGKATPPPLLVKRKVPVAALPVHGDLRPELYRIDFDLSFRAFGVRNSILLRHYLVDCAEPCARPGALVLKDWSKTSGVNDSMHGYLTSYAINILWIYFLVQKRRVAFKDPESIPRGVRDVTPEPKHVPLVPALLTTDDADADNNSGSSGETQHGKEGQKQQLYEDMGRLLVEFFSFYVFTFDWEKHVVSLNRPGVTTKQMLRWAEQDETTLAPGGGGPGGSGGGGLGGGSGGKNTRYEICIEDPYEDNLNLGRHIGAVRSMKFHDEFKRALLALIKGDFADSCVFPSSTAAAFLAKKEGKGNGDDGGDGGQPKSSSAAAAAAQTEDLTAVLQVALDVLEASTVTTAALPLSNSAGQTTTAELKAAFVERVPEAFGRVNGSMGWVQLMRALGLRVVGDIIRPFRSVSAMRKKQHSGGDDIRTNNNNNAESSSSSSSTSAGGDVTNNSSKSSSAAGGVGRSRSQDQPAGGFSNKHHQNEVRKEVDFVSLDLSDRVLATFVRELSVENVELLPKWMRLSPQQHQKVLEQQQPGEGEEDDLIEAEGKTEQKQQNGDAVRSTTSGGGGAGITDGKVSPPQADSGSEFISLSAVSSSCSLQHKSFPVWKKENGLRAVHGSSSSWQPTCTVVVPPPPPLPALLARPSRVSVMSALSRIRKF